MKYVRDGVHPGLDIDDCFTRIGSFDKGVPRAFHLVTINSDRIKSRSEGNQTLYPESKNIGVRLRIAALVNAGVKALRWLKGNEQRSRKAMIPIHAVYGSRLPPTVGHDPAVA